MNIGSLINDYSLLLLHLKNNAKELRIRKNTISANFAETTIGKNEELIKLEKEIHINFEKLRLVNDFLRDLKRASAEIQNSLKVVIDKHFNFDSNLNF